MTTLRLSALLLGLAFAAYPAERWQIQYSSDSDDAYLAINDLRFVTPERGIAVGSLASFKGGKAKPAGLITDDGGRTWTGIRMPDIGMSLSFSGAELGWMAGASGIWKTTSLGRDWTKVKGAHDLAAIAFAGREHGWAVGARNAAYETSNGGKDWRQIELPVKGKNAVVDYTAAAFVDGSQGMIAGTERPGSTPEGPHSPAFLEIWTVQQSKLVLLATRDGGKTWNPATSGNGRILQLRLTPAKKGLIAIESTAMRPGMLWGVSCWVGGVAFAAANLPVVPDPPITVMITDLYLAEDGAMYLAGYEPPGKLAHALIPGKLKVFRSAAGQKTWTELPVDYRAEARRAVFAPGPNGLWLATDTGLILKLVAE
jgi:photosystem II stability/assembly factor-like uncharacterized protein